MRGWKVSYEPEQGTLTVGPTRGEQKVLKVVGVGHSARSDYRYLAYELDDEEGEDESVPERHEEAVLDYLNKFHQGPWEVVPAEVLNSNWKSMSPREKERVLLREGFEAQAALP